MYSALGCSFTFMSVSLMRKKSERIDRKFKTQNPILSGLCVYNGLGNFSVKPDKKSPAKTLQVDQVSMIAGGTGITPMLQLITAVFRDPNDNTNLALLFANQSEDDILVREELEAIQAEHPDRFKVGYRISSYSFRP